MFDDLTEVELKILKTVYVQEEIALFGDETIAACRVLEHRGLLKSEIVTNGRSQFRFTVFTLTDDQSGKKA